MITEKVVKALLVLLGCGCMLQVSAQRDSLAPKFTIDIQGYDPVLAESSKITSETPAKDTTTATPPKLDYSIHTKPFDSQYEAATISSVKIKDPKLQIG